MKRIFVTGFVFLLLGIIAFTVSCRPRGQVSQEVSSDGVLRGSITFATWGSVDERIVNEEIIAAFERRHPGVRVHLEYIPEDYVARIDTMFLGGNAPDVLYGHPHYFSAWASYGLIADLTDRFEADRAFYSDPKFAQHMYGSFQYKGRSVATINGHDTFLLFYNKNLFDEAGVPYPNDTWTWDTFLDAALRLSNDVEGPERRYAFTFPNWPPNLFYLIYSFGGNIFDSMDNPTRVVFNSPETVEALRFIQDAIWRHRIAPSWTTFVEGISFDSGTIAMDVDGCWAPVGRRHITAFEWDMANMPIRPGFPQRTAAYYAGYAVNRASRNPDLAYAFARFFQEDEGQEILSGLGLITVINEEIASRPEILYGPGFPPNHGLRVSSISYATNGYANLSNWQEMIEMVFTPNFDDLRANNITPEECAIRVHEGLERLLRESQ